MTAETGTYRWMAPEVNWSWIYCLGIQLTFSLQFYLYLYFIIEIKNNEMVATLFLVFLGYFLTKRVMHWFLFLGSIHIFISFLIFCNLDVWPYFTSLCWFYFCLKVIEHKPYDQKADVFSFGISLWELLTGEVSTFMSGSELCRFIFYSFLVSNADWISHLLLLSIYIFYFL